MAVDKLIDSTELNTNITNLANAIRTKGGTSASLTFPTGMINAVNALSIGITPSGNKSITASTSTQSSIDVTNYATVSVAPTPSETKSTTVNGDVTPSSGKLLSKVTVNVPTGTARTSSDLTASGATVTVPAGLYAESASKSIASGTVSLASGAISVTPSAGTVSLSGTTLTVPISGSGSSTKTSSVSAGYIASASSASVSASIPSGASVSVTVPTETKTATANGSVNPSSGKLLSSVNVNIPEYDGTSDNFYIPCDYIESNGTQYIDTGWVHKSNSTIVLDCNIAQATTDTYLALFGSMNSTYTSNAWSLFCRYNSNYVAALARTGNEGTDANLVYNTRTTIIARGTKAAWTSSNSTNSVSSTGTSDNGAITMTLFTNHEGTRYNRHSSMKLYSAKFYTGNTLERDFIPCKNASDIYGLYDKVNGVFYPSIGSGQFTGG